MNGKYVKSLLLTALCASGAVFAADKATELKRSIDTTVDTYSVNKQRYEYEANNFVIEANKLFMKGEFLKAAENYARARVIYSKLQESSPHFARELEKTQELNAKAYYYLAQEMALKAHAEANSRDMETALKYCQQAIKIYPACRQEMEERIKAYKGMLDGAKRRERLKEENVIPDLQDNQYKVAVLLKQAKILFYNRQFEEARKHYKQALDIDKFCVEAIQGMRATDIQLAKAGENRFRLTHKKNMVAAGWEGVMPNVKHLSDAEREKNIAEGIDKDEDGDGVEAVGDETANIRKKLQEIVFPRVNFTGSGDNPGIELPQAVKYLVDNSKKYDKNGGEGVNIYLYFPQEKSEVEEGAQASAEQPAAAEENGEDSEEESEEESEKRFPTP